MKDALIDEQQFYSSYSWCLNPVLSVRDLLSRFQEEVDRYETLTGWQREESKTNLYLFACAVACTVDDFFGQNRLNLSPLGNRFPQLHGAIAAAQMVADVSHSMVIMRIGYRAAWHWRR